MIQLKKFEEIIDTDRGDQQTSQRIGHRVEGSYSLNEKYIDKRQERVYPKNIKDDPFRPFFIDNPVENEKIKAELKACEKVIEHHIIFVVLIKIISYTDHYPGHEQEKGKYFKINVRIALEINNQAGQKSNCDEYDIKVSRHSRTK